MIRTSDITMLRLTNTAYKRLFWSLGVLGLVILSYFVFHFVTRNSNHHDINKYLVDITSITLAEDGLIEGRDVPVLSLMNEEFIKLSKKVELSLVSIETKGAYIIKGDSQFGASKDKRLSTRGQGSGVIISKEGHIITAKHVVDKKRSYNIKLSNGRVVDASLIGMDDTLDIAVLKIDDHIEFSPMPFGNSDGTMPGQIVLACGNPFGLGTSVTRGLVNAKMRKLHNSSPEYIQTDAAIYPGNSGGPLINIQGEIIGINQASLAMDERNYRGISFAVPSNQVKRSFLQLCKYGKSLQHLLGCELIEFKPSMRTMCQYAGSIGVLVNSVYQGSPVQKAGIQAGDVLLEYNGKHIETLSSIYQLLQQDDVLGRCDFKVWRKGRTFEITCEFDKNPTWKIVDDYWNDLGLILRNINYEEYMQNLNGVFVVDVIDEKLKFSSIKRGDVVYRVNEIFINSTEDFKRELSKGPAKIYFMRNDGSQGSLNFSAPSTSSDT